MPIDDSFKKPGAVPFEWEIRPGTPKVHHKQCNATSPTSPGRLTPPPSGFRFQPPIELRTPSIVSSPHTRSERLRFDKSILGAPEVVVSGCFSGRIAPRLKKKTYEPKHRAKADSDTGSDYVSHLETLSHWSSSSHKSMRSPFHDDVVSSSSFASYQSSPRPVSDAEWGGFGLF